MLLTKFAYKEYEESERYWELEEFELGEINLIVGNNTSGKSRTLNVIFGLSNLLTNSTVLFNSGYYSACFKKGSDVIHYLIEFDFGNVTQERLKINDTEYFSRNSEGEGEIFNTTLSRKIEFKIPKNQLLVSRRDEKQFPYLEDLYQWASNTRHFRFSKEEEKNTFSVIDSIIKPTDQFNQKVTNQAIEVFKKGVSRFKDKFKQNVIKDFNSIGYNISSIDTGSLHSVKIDTNIGGKIVGLRVREGDREGKTDQHEMSDGMFRALSLIIHYNYYELSGKSLVVLIDDIGEGLDYERSTNLIKLLIEKSNKAGIQLIMSSNDKFVMNNTSLAYWQIISRTGGKVKMHNKKNSEEIFKKFKFTGLSNFDFFTTDFFRTGEQ